jgi:PucR family transcriptional regulator, purine catabolism regulatory protein
MPFTLKDVMNIPLFNQAKVLTANSSLQKRSVETVSVIEMPVEDFVRKNELVLTTAIGCGEDPLVFRKFVDDVLHSDAAALMVATGRHVSEIPDEVLRLAEEHLFPIIEVPWELRFADITQSVLSELNNWQRHSLQLSEELQKQLLHLFLNGGSLSDAAEVIYQKVGTPILILDREGSIKGKSQDTYELMELWNRNTQPVFTSPDQLKEVGWLRIWNDSLIQVKIQSANRILGYLLFFLSEGKTVQTYLDNREEQVLEHASTATALWFQRENAIQETEMRLKDDFIWSLAKGDQESWDMIGSRAKSLNYNVTLPYVCILGYPENLETTYRKSKPNDLSFEHWTYSMIHSIEEQISLARGALQREAMATYQRDRFVIFLESPLDQVNETVKEFLDLVEKRVDTIYPGMVISWGIGENHAGIQTFHESYQDARIALDIGRRQKGPGHRSTYANTGVFRALFTLANNPDMQEITLSTIGVLIDYDNQRGLDLIHTLATYIRHQGNVSQTSRTLSLHRQSLLYRLRKIESLTGRSLVDPDDIFLLDLSIKLWTSGLTYQANKT